MTAAAARKIAQRWLSSGGPRVLEHPHVIQVICDQNGAQGILDVLKYFRWCGSIGHSCSLKDDNLIVGGFDGDGTDWIDSLTYDGKPVEKYTGRHE